MKVPRLRWKVIWEIFLRDIMEEIRDFNDSFIFFSTRPINKSISNFYMHIKEQNIHF